MDLSANKQFKDDICYHHFSLVFDGREVETKFNNIRFVLVAGCARRADRQAKFLAENLFNGFALEKYEFEKLTNETSRFSLFKVGPVLISEHGMGPASMSIAMHELLLMCQVAKVIDKVTFIRFGTCGGIGVQPGTLCITNKAFDPLFNEHIELKVCGKLIKRPAVIDQATSTCLYEFVSKEPNHEELGHYDIKLGATIGTNDFYEEQGRTNGAICDHSQQDKFDFLQRAQQNGVVNMEMESNHLASMCHKLSVSFGIVCVALNNRLNDDRVLLTKDEMSLFERRLFWTNSVFIRHKLTSS